MGLFGHMRSITVKLTLAFLLVGITGAVLVAAIVLRRTRAAFDLFLLDRDQQALVDRLVQYYQINQSWDGLAESSLGFQIDRGKPSTNHDFRSQVERFTLVGADGLVLFSLDREQVGEQLSNQELSNAISLVVDGENAGWLLLTTNPQRALTSSSERIFLSAINRATLTSALIASILALILGGALAYTMTRSLRELKEATVEISQGKLGKQVQVRSKDEVGELAASFNQMSKDLERATQVRRQMTADIAHDLRSPLSVISGYAEALSDGKLPGTDEIYTILSQESQHLSRLVEDLRTLSLADAGVLQLMLQPLSPEVILSRAINAYRVQAEQGEITLRSEVAASLPDIRVDAERMAQVLSNLLSNSLRYTPAGGEIVLAAEQLGQNVRIMVRDNGAGITAEDLPNIFERSYRADKARRDDKGETGLGLSIAKSLVEAQGGTISAESISGAGTTISIYLPVAGT